MLATKNPTLTVNIEKFQKCTIASIKLAHCGNENERFFYNKRQEHVDYTADYFEL